MNTSVCIVGVGAATSLGPNAAVTGTAVRAGLTGFCEHPYWIGPDGEPLVVAMAGYLPRALPPIARIAELGTLGLKDVSSKLTRELCDVPLFLAQPESTRIGYPGDEILHELRRLSREGTAPIRIGQLNTVRRGHAGGVAALEQAMSYLRDEKAQFCLVGAIDSWLFPNTLEALDQSHRFKSRMNRWGFVPGEAVAFCLLCSRRVAQRFGLYVYGEVLSARTADEQTLGSSSAVNTGQGLAMAVRAALSALPTGANVDDVFCDLNGMRSRADEFGFTFMRVGRRMGDHFQTPASAWGDIGAASVLTTVSAAVIVAERGFPRGPHVLLTASSDDELRGATLLHLPAKRGPEC